MLSEESVDSEANAGPLAGGWLVVGLLWVVAVLNYLDRGMLTTMRQSIITAIPMTEAEFGVLGTVFLWVYGAFSPIAGFLADRVNRVRIIVVSVLVWSAVTYLTARARSYNELLIARALMGISEACYVPAALALIMDYHRGRSRSLANGIHLSGLTFGGAAGGVGGWLASKFDWTFPFTLFGIVGIVYAVVLFAALRDPRRTSSDSSSAALNRPRVTDAFVALVSNPKYLLVVMVFSIMGFAGWALNYWTPAYLQTKFDLSQAKSGFLALGSVQGLACIGIIVGGAWADYLSRTNPRARIVVSMVGLTTAAVGVIVAANAQFLWLVLLGLASYGLARVFADANIMPIVCQVLDSRYRATAYGILNMFSCFAGGIATYLVGKFRDQKIDPAYIFLAAGVGLIVAVILLFIVSREKRVTGAEVPLAEP